MSPLTLAALAFSLSVDSFVVALGRGAAHGRPSLAMALRTGLTFGLIEALTPLLGWTLGFAASRFVEAYAHWIAFALLVGVGGHMALAACRAEPEEEAQKTRSRWTLIAAAVGTSIDAMAVGVSLALLDISIYAVSLAVGVTTFSFVTGGVMLGRFLGERFGRRIEFCAGLLLCAIGAMILYQHLSA